VKFATLAPMRRFLVQPDAGGRISGGYLYNQRMVEHSPTAAVITLVDVPVSVAREHLAGMAAAADDVVLADSLFLYPERLGPFLALAARGVRVGMMLHALPSFIERAAAGHISHEPTATERTLLDQLDLVVVSGPYLHEVLTGRIAAPIAICLPGIDDAWRRTTPPAEPAPAARERELALLSVGAVTPNKGFDDVVDALALLGPGPRVRWRIAGSTDVDPGYSAALRHRIERAGLSGQVEILGQRPVDETRSLFAGADVFVLASYTENHPLTAVEALASCVPVVAYAVGGLPAIVRDGETGLLAQVRDTDALARHLGRMLGDAALRQRMAMRAWELRHTLLSWPEAAAALSRALARRP
jgi:glycosyltransferase involved in cell wall biosynthesis